MTEAERICGELQQPALAAEAYTKAKNGDNLVTYEVMPQCPTAWEAAMDAVVANAVANAPKRRTTTVPPAAPTTPVPTTAPGASAAPANTNAVDDGGINAGEAREIKAALVSEGYPEVAESVMPVELNQIAEESCAFVASADTYATWQAGIMTDLTTRMLVLDPTEDADHRWIGSMVTLSTDRACHTPFQALLAAKGGG